MSNLLQETIADLFEPVSRASVVEVVSELSLQFTKEGSSLGPTIDGTNLAFEGHCGRHLVSGMSWTCLDLNEGQRTRSFVCEAPRGLRTNF